MKNQTTIVCNGNEAVAKAILHVGYDGEGYYPITPSSEAGEEVSKAYAAGETDLAFVVGTSELAAISTCAGMAIAGGRAVDVTSAQGLLLKAEQMPAISGLGLPMVLNLSARDISAPLNIKCGHSDLVQALGWGWIILMAPTVQATYDMNIIAPKIGEAVNLPVIVCYDGFLTSHANRRIQVFENPKDVAEWVGPVPERINFLDVYHPHTFGPYMNDDLINTKVQLDLKMEKAYELLPKMFKDFEEFSGRKYTFVDRYGPEDADVTMVIMNSASECAKDAVDELKSQGKKVAVVAPMVLRPYPEKEMIEAVGKCPVLLCAERVSQYGSNNYLANELGASLQKVGSRAKILQRTFGVGGIAFTADDCVAMFENALQHEKATGDEKREKWYYGAWAGDTAYKPVQTLQPVAASECSKNAGSNGKVSLKELSGMPDRINKHSACPGCGIFTNLGLFLKGIDGHVVFIFNTGCGMVVTTGYPLTSFKVPYFHNLFHNGTSTATGVVEMIKRFKKQGKLPEDITCIVVSGDGGDDIGMDQVIGAALRNDPMIVLEYDNKGYMNTGSQLCYTGFRGQRSSNAHLGPQQTAKQTHHKDIIEILRGTHCSYLFQAAESNPLDMIRKARKAQATVRAGGFAFGKLFSVCPLNWGMEEASGPTVIKKSVDSCIHPLYEIERGITKLNYNPEKTGKKIPVTDAFKVMGRAFSHLCDPKYADLTKEVQDEVDLRWSKLVAMDASEVL